MVGWSPGTIAVLVPGAFLVALGLVEFFTGARFSNLTASSVNGLAFRQSGVLALIEIGFGIALAGWSSSLSSVFGGDPASGWVFMAAGAIVVASAFVPRRRVGAPSAVTADLETPEAPAKPIRRAG